MRKPYAFSPDECISIHPSRLDAIRIEFGECLEVLRLLIDYAFHRSEVVADIPGMYQSLDMLHDRIEAGVQSLNPDTLGAMPAGLEEVVEEVA